MRKLQSKIKWHLFSEHGVYLLAYIMGHQFLSLIPNVPRDLFDFLIAIAHLYFYKPSHMANMSLYALPDIFICNNWLCGENIKQIKRKAADCNKAAVKIFNAS